MASRSREKRSYREIYDRVRAGVLTDIHVSLDPERRASWHNEYDFAGVRARLRQAAELFAAADVDFVLALGDLAHDGDAPSLREALAPLAGGAPLFVVGGNHDGLRPTAALAALTLDGIRLPGWRALRAAPRARVAGVRAECREPGQWTAARPPALATWGEELVLLATHFPLLSLAAEVRARGLPYAGDLAGRAVLADALLGRLAPTLVVCGHLHVRESTTSGMLLQLASGALIEPPFEATIVDAQPAGDGLRVTRTAHELDAAPERRDPRLAPAEETWRFSLRGGWRRSRPGSRPPRAQRRAL
jgi:predicted phosphodiesterase